MHCALHNAAPGAEVFLSQACTDLAGAERRFLTQIIRLVNVDNEPLSLFHFICIQIVLTLVVLASYSKPEA